MNDDRYQQLLAVVAKKRAESAAVARQQSDDYDPRVVAFRQAAAMRPSDVSLIGVASDRLRRSYADLPDDLKQKYSMEYRSRTMVLERASELAQRQGRALAIETEASGLAGVGQTSERVAGAAVHGIGSGLDALLGLVPGVPQTHFGESAESAYHSLLGGRFEEGAELQKASPADVEELRGLGIEPDPGYQKIAEREAGSLGLVTGAAEMLGGVGGLRAGAGGFASLLSRSKRLGRIPDAIRWAAGRPGGRSLASRAGAGAREFGLYEAGLAEGDAKEKFAAGMKGAVTGATLAVGGELGAKLGGKAVAKIKPKGKEEGIRSLLAKLFPEAAVKGTAEAAALRLAEPVGQVVANMALPDEAEQAPELHAPTPEEALLFTLLGIAGKRSKGATDKAKQAIKAIKARMPAERMRRMEADEKAEQARLDARAEMLSKKLHGEYLEAVGKAKPKDVPGGEPYTSFESALGDFNKLMRSRRRATDPKAISASDAELQKHADRLRHEDTDPAVRERFDAYLRNAAGVPGDIDPFLIGEPWMAPEGGVTDRKLLPAPKDGAKAPPEPAPPPEAPRAPAPAPPVPEPVEAKRAEPATAEPPPAPAPAPAPEAPKDRVDRLREMMDSPEVLDAVGAVDKLVGTGEAFAKFYTNAQEARGKKAEGAIANYLAHVEERVRLTAESGLDTSGKVAAAYEKLKAVMPEFIPKPKAVEAPRETREEGDEDLEEISDADLAEAAGASRQPEPKPAPPPPPRSQPSPTPTPRPLSAAIKGKAASVTDVSHRKSYEVIYELRDAKTDVRTALDEGFPKEKQPRDMSRLANRATVENIARDLHADALAVSPIGAYGAPIIDEAGNVEAGNHRMEAIRATYNRYPESAERYRKFLTDNAASFGLTPEAVASVKHPVLVRRRVTPVQDADIRQYIQDIGASDVQEMSLPEAATARAKLITDDVVSLFRGGDIGSEANLKFAQAVISKLPDAQHNRFLTATGELSQAGKSEIGSAIFTRVYKQEGMPSGRRLVDWVTDDAENPISNVVKGMKSAQESMLALEKIAREPDMAEYAIADDVVRAAEMIAEFRNSMLNKPQFLERVSAEMFQETGSDAAKLFELFDEFSRSAKKTGALLNNYVEIVNGVMSMKSGSLFGEAPLSKAEAIDEAAKRVRDAAYEARTGKPSSQAEHDSHRSLGAAAADDIFPRTPTTSSGLNIPFGKRGNIKQGASRLIFGFEDVIGDANLAATIKAEKDRTVHEAVETFDPLLSVMKEYKGVPDLTDARTDEQFREWKGKHEDSFRELNEVGRAIEEGRNPKDVSSRGKRLFEAIRSYTNDMRSVIVKHYFRDVIRSVEGRSREKLFSFYGLLRARGLLMDGEVGVTPDVIKDRIELLYSLEPGESRSFEVDVKSGAEVSSATLTISGWGLPDYMPHVWKKTKGGAPWRAYDEIESDESLMPGSPEDVVEGPQGSLTEGEKATVAQHRRAIRGALNRGDKLIPLRRTAKNLLARIKGSEGYVWDPRVVFGEYANDVFRKIAYERGTDVMRVKLAGDQVRAGRGPQGFDIDRFLSDVVNFVPKWRNLASVMGGRQPPIEFAASVNLKLGKKPRKAVPTLTRLSTGEDVPLNADTVAEANAAQWHFHKATKDSAGKLYEIVFRTPDGTLELRTRSEAAKRLGLRIRKNGLINWTKREDYDYVADRVRELFGYDVRTGKILSREAERSPAVKLIRGVGRTLNEFMYTVALGGGPNVKAAVVNYVTGMNENLATMTASRANDTRQKMKGFFKFHAYMAARGFSEESYQQAKKKFAGTSYVANVLPTLEAGYWVRDSLTEMHHPSNFVGWKGEWRKRLRGYNYAGFRISEAYVREFKYIADYNSAINHGAIHNGNMIYDVTPDYVEGTGIAGAETSSGYGMMRKSISAHTIARQGVYSTHFNMESAFMPGIMRLPGWKTVGHLSTTQTRIMVESWKGFGAAFKGTKNFFAEKRGKTVEPLTPEERFRAMRLTKAMTGYILIASLAKIAFNRDMSSLVGVHPADIKWLVDRVPAVASLPNGVRFYGYTSIHDASMPLQFIGTGIEGILSTVNRLALGNEQTGDVLQDEWEDFARANPSIWLRGPMGLFGAPVSRTVKPFMELATANEDPSDPEGRMVVRDDDGNAKRRMSLWELYANAILPGSYYPDMMSHRLAAGVRAEETYERKARRAVKRRVLSGDPEERRQGMRLAEERGYDFRGIEREREALTMSRLVQLINRTQGRKTKQKLYETLKGRLSPKESRFIRQQLKEAK